MECILYGYCFLLPADDKTYTVSCLSHFLEVRALYKYDISYLLKNIFYCIESLNVC